MDFDLDNLSPEDRALFDAMVKEEMMKLELEFQQQAEIQSIKSPLQEPSNYHSSHRDDVSYKPPPRVHQNQVNNYSNYNDNYIERESPRNNNYNYNNNNNNNNNNRNNYHDNDRRSKDIEIDIQVKGPRPKEFGNSELTREEKRSKQLEYARQLSEQTSQAQLQAQNQPNSNSNQRNTNNPKRNSTYGNEPEEQYGLQLGGDDSKDSKKSKQREYARLLEMDQRAAAGGNNNNYNNQESNQRTSLSANSRSKSNPRGSSDDRRSELSSSRSDSTPRARPSGNLISGGPVLDERQAKIQKQQQYARELQQQQDYKNSERDNLHNSPSNYKSSSSSRNNSYEPLNSSPSQNSKNNFNEKNLKQQKQQEYAQQLANDQRNKEILRNNDDNPRQRNTGLTPRNSGSGAPYQSPTSDRGDYYHSPSNPFNSNQPSEKDMKIRKQQEYARQLELDKLSKEKIQGKDSSRSNNSNSYAQSPSNLSYQSSSSSILGSQDYDPRQEKMQKRREQEEYARQIRDAASQQEILSPRISLAKKKNQQFPSYDDDDNATGLILPGANITTAVQKDNKRLQQEKYRQQLDEAQSIRPVDSGRAPLHRKNKSDYGDNDYGVNGLIGNHESEEEKRRKKKESQNKYFDDLSRQAQGSNNINNRGGGGSGRDQGQMEEPPYDPRGIVKRDNSREVRDVSPIIYPSKSNKQSQQQQQQQQYSNYDDNYHYDNNNKINNGNNYNNYNDRYYDDDEDNRSLQQLKDHASRHINTNSNFGNDRGYPSTAAAVAAASGSPYRQSNRPPYQNYDLRLEPKPEPQPQPYVSPRQSKNSQDSIPKYQKPTTAECTGLVIGGMTVLTAEQKAEKQRQQQQYARDVAEAKNAHPIHVERESYQERHRYKGNGLPGEYQGVRGASNGGGASSIQLGGGGYNQYQQQQQYNQYERNDGEYRIRGTSNGGGASSISFGGDSGDLSPRQQKMQRKGKQEEYASQLRQQMNYNNSNKN
eukprot:CAMPEP_0174818966 /NCGR_PEP_ID=MMETSP1107-20130205/1937_1 /TAXON_ID=36770 /ORGANISM="Paraphysomonas vestita, Strain GFlagA" /LENGTH=985 /DNA_ID=CAMNT_0016031647 /DNA_START=66 /DNA_END=3020 /DNA_ORIENTATION=-